MVTVAEWCKAWTVSRKFPGSCLAPDVPFWYSTLCCREFTICLSQFTVFCFSLVWQCLAPRTVATVPLASIPRPCRLPICKPYRLFIYSGIYTAHLVVSYLWLSTFELCHAELLFELSYVISIRCYLCVINTKLCLIRPHMLVCMLFNSALFVGCNRYKGMPYQAFIHSCVFACSLPV